MIEVTFQIFGDGGESLGDVIVGYFDNERKAKKALTGLCPWDFDSMWASSDYKDFHFTKRPGILDPIRDKKFIKETNSNLEKARKHAKEWEGSWHHRAPENPKYW
jgi:hypothetical protein